MAKYAFIDTTNSAEPGRYGIKNMCRWLAVSPSGFFTWRFRPPSARAVRHEKLTALVRWSFERSNSTYGYRRVHADLVRRGVEVGEDLVRDITRAQDLVACQPRPFRTTTVPGDGAGGCSAVTSRPPRPAASSSATSPTSTPGPASPTWPP